MKKTIGLGLAAVLVLGFGATGCKKKKKKDGPSNSPSASASPGASTGPGATTAPAPSSSPVSGQAGVGADALAFLPGDIKAAVGISMAGAKKSSFFDMLKNKMLSEDKDGEFLKFVQDCKFDPFTQIEWMTVGMSELGKGSDFAAVAVRGKFDEANLMPCVVQKSAEKNSNDKFTSEDYKGKKLYVNSKNPDKVMAFVNPDTLVVGKKEFVTGLLDGTASTAKGGAVSGLVGKVDTSQALWLAIAEMPQKGLGGPMPMPGAAPKAMWGSIDFSSGVAAKLSMQLADAGAAKTMADMANQQAGMAKQFFDKLNVTANGDTVNVELSMTEQQIKMLIGMIGMGMKHRGGMGPGGP